MYGDQAAWGNLQKDGGVSARVRNGDSVRTIKVVQDPLL
jgi:hypothetical protein